MFGLAGAEPFSARGGDQVPGARRVQRCLAAEPVEDEQQRCRPVALAGQLEAGETDAGTAERDRHGDARREVRQAMITLRTAAAEPTTLELVTTVRHVLARVGLTEQPPAGGAAKERWDALLALVGLAEELAATVEGADLPRYVAELEQRASAQHPPTVEGVTLASLHAAKGLEWDAVFLVGLADGTVPIQHADGDEGAIEEERRLFYVGVTRAREHLWLSWSLARHPGGRRHRRRSRFLYGLLPDHHPAARGSRSSQGRQSKGKPRCRICGGPLLETMEIKLNRCGRCPSSVDEDLLERLKDWRSARARELKVPAFVVFTDATLVAIAEQRPADSGGLVSISGIGPTKVERFGAEVLAVVRAEHD